jgi:hypothetical protein
MANLFDAANAPEGEPTEIVVGDFIQWKKENIASDYPPATHSAEYVARITGGGSNEIKLPATEVSGYYLFTVDSTTSADFSAGRYHWQLEITETSSGNRLVIERGEFTAIVDLDVNQSDPRIHAEKMVPLLETILEAKAAGGDVSSYSIGGRSASKMTFEELFEIRDRYKAELHQHRQNELIKRGKATSNTVKVRFI